MARIIDFQINTKMFNKFIDQVEDFDIKADRVVRASMFEVANGTLALVKLKTPVGLYAPYFYKGKIENQGRVGGTLRDSWRVSNLQYSNNEYSIDVFTNIEYAEYVEYGHRQTPGRYVPAIGKKLKAPFVEGKFMLTKSIEEIQPKVTKIFSKHVKREFEL